MTLRHRLDAGWPIEKALMSPPGESPSSGLNITQQIMQLREQMDRIEMKLDELLGKPDS